jgi:predicted secreted protein
MAYSISTAFAIYFVLWWLVLFLTLPFGVRSQHEDGEGAGQVIPGTDPGAPVLARMGSKLIWTTIISAVIFAISMWAYYQGYFNIERLAKLMGMPF